MNRDWLVLVVEDSGEYRDVIEFMLPCDCKVTFASNINEAMDSLPTRDWDLVIVDIRLKDSDESNVDGLKVIKEGARVQPTAKFVATSAYAEHDIRITSLASGADVFVAKPFKPKDFRMIVESLMGVE